MNLLDQWLKIHIQTNTAPLFDTSDLKVKTFSHNSMEKLKRHPKFDELMINTVEKGLDKDSWEGFIYIMYWLLNGEIIPLYIGKAERKGVKKPISFNIENIKKNQHAFGRWGYGLAYHIGDLSHAIFREEAYKKPNKKYDRWAQRLFVELSPEPVLKYPVYVSIISWNKGMKGPSGLIGTVPSVEKELISLAGGYYPDTLLNVDGK